MDYKKIAAIFAAAAIIGSSSYGLVDAFVSDNVVTVSAASSLRRNSTGSEVTQLQNNLIKLNYMKSGSATGTYDSATESAVKSFQTDYQLTADGIAGSQTLGLVDSIISGTTKIVEVKADLLNVRYTASKSGKLLTTVKAGQKFIVEGESSDSSGTKWYKIKTKYGSGYICSDYAAAINPASDNSSQTTEGSGVVKVTGTVLNVRQSASTSSQKLCVIKTGQTFNYSKIQKVNGETWYFIKVNNSISGWVLGNYVSASPDSNSTATTTKTTTKSTTASTAAADANSGKVTVTAELLNVRESASSSANKLLIIKKNEVYTYSQTKTAENIQWYYIKVNNSISGWVMGTYVKATPNSTSATTQTTKATETTQSSDSGNVLTVTADLLNVRESASTSSKKLFIVKNGQKYTYSKTQKVGNDTWYYIKVNNSISGWVMGTYVKVNSSETATTAKSTQKTQNTTTAASGEKTLIVATSALNVREAATTSSKKVYLVKNGQKYTYSKTQKVGSDTWYFIKVSNSVSGWVNGKYVNAETATTTKATSATTKAASTTTKATSATTTKAASSGKLSITANLLNVRSDASTKSKIITTVKKNKTYSFTNVKTVNNEKWYYITVSSSQKGWVNGGYVVIVGNTATTTTTKKTTNTTSPSTLSQNKTLVIEANLLNVRINAASDATVIGTVKKDKVYEYAKVASAENITWYYIKLSDVRWGWVMGTYVRTLDETAPAQSEPTTGNLTVNSNAAVYMGAGTNYEKVADVKKGATYQYVNIRDGWYRIVLSQDKMGWIDGSHVTTHYAKTLKSDASSQGNVTTATEKATTTTTKATTTTTKATTTTTKATTTTTEKPTTTTTAEKTTTAIQDSASTTGSTTGTETGSSSSTAADSGKAVAANTRTVLVGTVSVSGTLNIRKGAGTNYSIIGNVKNGTKLVIAEKGSKWHKVEYGSGYGYVMATYVKDIKTTTETVALSYATVYYYLEPGQTVNLARTVKNSTVTYTSSDPEKCPVDKKGIATGKSAGLYNITAKCGNSSAVACVVVLDAPNSNVPTFKISEEGAKFIAEWEGGGTVLPTGETVYYPYKDVSGFWTVGFGHAKTSTASKSWSEDRAISEFNKDIESLIGKEYVLTKKQPYLTEATAKMLLNADLNKGDYVKSINNWASRNGVILNQAQFDALVSFCYNLGSSLWDSDSSKFYLKSAIISHRSGDLADPAQIIEGFCRYHKSSGKSYKGLWYRRRNEAELFLTGDYAIDRANKFQLPSNISWS